MVLVITLGAWAGGLEYDFDTNSSDTCGSEVEFKDCKGLNKNKHMTYIFNIFVFLQLGNQFNCRKIGAKDYNIFDGITSNFYFIMVVIITFTIQVSI